MPNHSNKKIMIAIPSAPSDSFVRGLVRFLVYAAKLPNIVIHSETGKPCECAHNKIVKTFLGSSCDYLLTLDTDMLPPPNILSLADHDKDVCSALTFCFKAGKVTPIACDKVSADEYRVSEKLATQERMILVDMASEACMMIRRDVLETVSPPWYASRYDDYGVLKLGHDFDFCEKVKAEGFEIWIDRAIICDHVVKMGLKEVEDYARALNG